MVSSGVSTRREGDVLQLVLDKPEKLNAVDTPMLQQLRDAIWSAAEDDSLRVVALTGSGRAFCSGGDLTSRDTAGAGAAASEVIDAITALRVPVVAGLHGPAVGVGCALALACDLAVMAESAFFQLAFTKVGLMTDGGVSALVAAAVGRARASRMALLAEKIHASTAFEWGMISHVVSDADYRDEFGRVVAELAGGPTLAYGWIKRALAASTLADMDAVHQVESQGQDVVSRSADVRVAVRAFRERTTPKFGGS